MSNSIFKQSVSKLDEAESDVYGATRSVKRSLKFVEAQSDVYGATRSVIMSFLHKNKNSVTAFHIVDTFRAISVRCPHFRGRVSHTRPKGGVMINGVSALSVLF